MAQHQFTDGMGKEQPGAGRPRCGDARAWPVPAERKRLVTQQLVMLFGLVSPARHVTPYNRAWAFDDPGGIRAKTAFQALAGCDATIAAPKSQSPALYKIKRQRDDGIMLDNNAANLHETALHDWHVAHGGKMVEFGGWDMPVQYKTGIIQEHLATRRNAGLFDVSHMGRFSVTGKQAEAFLLHVLTNNAKALEARHAQYTFIANDDGDAVDDAYLYKLSDDDFLLVVNAATREKDWRWLQQHNSHAGAEMTDVSDELAMISLQGPNSSAILEQLITKEDLPENKRNRLNVATVQGHEVIIARTGYTGEAVCFELFPELDYAAELWETLVRLGAVPAGLGARDSLRLEAGLPLYGHELGPGPTNGEIPIFANAIAKFAVRAPDHQDYIGKTALEKQRQ
ncbi:MAG: glycine cleavage system aminomethyltransferase GcvT, partial [Nitrospira sp.]|nr:glycine cleavage system aminomethyltransferase GcvT [Nitrospira sp.]